MKLSLSLFTSFLVLSVLLVSSTHAFAHRKDAYSHTKKTHSFPYKHTSR